jgi:hypothetical protein
MLQKPRHLLKYVGNWRVSQPTAVGPTRRFCGSTGQQLRMAVSLAMAVGLEKSGTNPLTFRPCYNMGLGCAKGADFEGFRGGRSQFRKSFVFRLLGRKKRLSRIFSRNAAEEGVSSLAGSLVVLFTDIAIPPHPRRLSPKEGVKKSVVGPGLAPASLHPGQIIEAGRGKPRPYNRFLTASRGKGLGVRGNSEIYESRD